MTEKENYLKVLRREKAEWVPEYLNACQWGGPVVYPNKFIPGTGNPDKKIIDFFGMEYDEDVRYTDMLGVEYIQSINGAMPVANKHVITDITKWREQIPYPFPDLETIDYDAQAQAFNSAIDRDEKALAYMGGGRFFDLINTMGVAEALVTMIEKPEAVHDFFKEMTDYDEKKLRLSYDAFKPEIYIIGDDVATVRDLFFSPETYDELIAPYHRQLAKVALEYGMIVEMHCCGKCEKLIPRWIDMGITVWQPAQAVNDLKTIKEKYGDKLVLNGCWDVAGEGGMTGASEEVVRRSVRETIDEFAPGGGYVFWDTGLTGGDVQKFEWTADEARKYGITFYKKK